MNIKTYLGVFIAIVTLGISQLALADSSWNQVEILVFSRGDVSTLTPTKLNDNYAIPKDAINLLPIDPKDSDPAFHLLPAKDFLLKRAAKRLSDSGNYQILLHLAWRQPIGDRSVPIHLQGGAVYDAAGDVVDTTLSQDLPEDAHHQIDGIMRLSRTPTYFATRLRLQLSSPMTNLNLGDGSEQSLASSGITGLKTLLLQGDQHLKLDKLSYFDNPNFGAIVVISKYNYSPRISTNIGSSDSTAGSIKP